jgi:antitoxin (DNA-binding transcriptional repressor) of toxin-antitoxin stability system
MRFQAGYRQEVLERGKGYSTWETFQPCHQGFCTANSKRVRELAVSVYDAAKDSLRVIERVESEGQPTVLFRTGKPVAWIVPFPAAAVDREELASRWEKIDRRSTEEGEEFARDLQDVRMRLIS